VNFAAIRQDLWKPAGSFRHGFGPASPSEYQGEMRVTHEALAKYRQYALYQSLKRHQSLKRQSLKRHLTGEPRHRTLAWKLTGLLPLIFHIGKP
jgi:hypothetical protein